VAHQGATVDEFAAADVAGTGALTPTAMATISGLSNTQQSAFNPPPYSLPLSR